MECRGLERTGVVSRGARHAGPRAHAIRSMVVAIATISVGGCAVTSNGAERAAPSTPRHAALAPEPEPWCTAQSARSTEKAVGISGPLSDLSERFREAHQRARADACRRLASRQLVIRYAFGTVEARWNGIDLGEPVVLFTPYVHALKAVSHAAFLAALLFDQTPGPERDAHVAAAVRDVDALRAALADPATQAAKLFPPAELPRQIHILTLTSGALGALHDARSGARARQDYFSAVKTPVNDNLRNAAAAVLTRLHQTVAGYKRRVDAQDSKAWASLVVVASVAHQARAREIAVQYFERLLGETVSEGASQEDRLVVVESQLEAADQRGSLAAHEVDREYARLMFGDPSRLQRDVMADSGDLLDKLFSPEARAQQTATP